MRYKLPLAALAVLASFGGIYVALRDSTPRLTREVLEENRRKWHASGLKGYSLSLRVENSMQAAQTFSLTVREGEVATFSVNGRQASNNESYSVTGLFEILEREIEMLEGKEPGLKVHPEDTELRADFDSTLGFPRVFKRIAPKYRSTFIHVTAFERI